MSAEHSGRARNTARRSMAAAGACFVPPPNRANLPKLRRRVLGFLRGARATPVGGRPLCPRSGLLGIADDHRGRRTAKIDAAPDRSPERSPPTARAMPSLPPHSEVSRLSSVVVAENIPPDRARRVFEDRRQEARCGDDCGAPCGSMGRTCGAAARCGSMGRTCGAAARRGPMGQAGIAIGPARAGGNATAARANAARLW